MIKLISVYEHEMFSNGYNFNYIYFSIIKTLLFGKENYY